MAEVTIAIAGATGELGRVVLAALEDTGVEAGQVRALASAASVEDTLMFRNRPVLVEDLDEFDFATAGIAALKDSALQTRLADGYVEVTWRKGLEKTTAGLPDALDFRERAKTFKTAIAILGDPVMRRVVTTALGIPQQIAFQELGAQERAITSRLDLSRLQDQKFVDGMSQRYLLEKQKAAAAAPPDMSALSMQLRGIVA